QIIADKSLQSFSSIGRESYHSSSVKSCRRMPGSFDWLRMNGWRQVARGTKRYRPRQATTQGRPYGIGEGAPQCAPTTDEEPPTLTLPHKGGGARWLARKGGGTVADQEERREAREPMRRGAGESE